MKHYSERMKKIVKDLGGDPFVWQPYDDLAKLIGGHNSDVSTLERMSRKAGTDLDLPCERRLLSRAEKKKYPHSKYLIRFRPKRYADEVTHDLDHEALKAIESRYLDMTRTVQILGEKLEEEHIERSRLERKAQQQNAKIRELKEELAEERAVSSALMEGPMLCAAPDETDVDRPRVAFVIAAVAIGSLIGSLSTFIFL